MLFKCEIYITVEFKNPYLKLFDINMQTFLKIKADRIFQYESFSGIVYSKFACT